LSEGDVRSLVTEAVQADCSTAVAKQLQYYNVYFDLLVSTIL